MAFGGSGYGSNIYGTTENGGNVHRLRGYIEAFQQLKGFVTGILGRTVSKLGVSKSNVGLLGRTVSMLGVTKNGL